MRKRPYGEHTCLNDIKKIYQHAGKCYDQKNFKDIIDAAMVSTPEEVTDFSPSTIRIHCHMSNITQVRSDVWSGVAYLKYGIGNLKAQYNNTSSVRKYIPCS